MKWSEQKTVDIYSKCRIGIQARNKGNKFLISDSHGSWYIEVCDTKSDKVYNSLWGKISYEDIEDAKKWCERFDWTSVRNGGLV